MCELAGLYGHVKHSLAAHNLEEQRALKGELLHMREYLVERERSIKQDLAEIDKFLGLIAEEQQFSTTLASIKDEDHEDEAANDELKFALARSAEIAKEAEEELIELPTASQPDDPPVWLLSDVRAATPDGPIAAYLGTEILGVLQSTLIWFDGQTSTRFWAINNESVTEDDPTPVVLCAREAVNGRPCKRRGLCRPRACQSCIRAGQICVGVMLTLYNNLRPRQPRIQLQPRPYLYIHWDHRPDQWGYWIGLGRMPSDTCTE